MRKSICHGMVAAALVAGMTLPICAHTAYADAPVQEAASSDRHSPSRMLEEAGPGDIQTVTPTPPDETAREQITSIVSLSEGVALAVACVTLALRRHADGSEERVNADAEAQPGDAAEYRSDITAADRKGDGSLPQEQPMQARRKTSGTATSRFAHASGAMCRTLQWLLAPIIVWVAVTFVCLLVFDRNPFVEIPDLRSTAFTTLWELLLSFAYMRRCSRLAKEVSSQANTLSDTEVESLLKRHWAGTLFLSGGLVFAGLGLSLVVILLASAPFAMARLGRMQAAHPERPAWRIALAGIGMMLVMPALVVFFGMFIFGVWVALMLALFSVSGVPALIALGIVTFAVLVFTAVWLMRGVFARRKHAADQVTSENQE